VLTTSPILINLTCAGDSGGWHIQLAYFACGVLVLVPLVVTFPCCSRGGVGGGVSGSAIGVLGCLRV
jgi:hypothetical protein